MFIWLCFSILTAVALAALLVPFGTSRSASVTTEEGDIAVYRDQLDELSKEKERGLISAEEADLARTEVSRRLLKHAAGLGTSSPPNTPTPSARWQASSLALLALVPVVTVLAYASIGTPNLPARPFAERKSQPIQDATVADVIARIEERLRAVPDDGEGWNVVAPVYARLGRFADAAYSYAQANRILGVSAKRLLGFAEATLMAEGGIVTPPVRDAANRVLALEPNRPEPKFWLALGKEQDGNVQGAIEDYRALIATAPDQAPWKGPLVERLELLTKQNPTPGAQKPAGGDNATAPQLTPAIPQAAPDMMSEEQRNAFIGSMVERLSARLQENGHDLEGWLKLIRSYKVLGRDADALRAAEDARKNHAAEAAALQQIDALVTSLAIGSKK